MLAKVPNKFLVFNSRSVKLQWFSFVRRFPDNLARNLVRNFHTGSTSEVFLRASTFLIPENPQQCRGSLFLLKRFSNQLSFLTALAICSHVHAEEDSPSLDMKCVEVGTFPGGT